MLEVDQATESTNLWAYRGMCFADSKSVLSGPISSASFLDSNKDTFFNKHNRQNTLKTVLNKFIQNIDGGEVVRATASHMIGP